MQIPSVAKLLVGCIVIVQCSCTSFKSSRPLPGDATSFRQPANDTTLNGIRVVETDSTLEIFNANRPILTYHKKTVYPPGNLPEYYKRSGFIHPLYSPSGQVMTDGFPAGHAHQHGIFMTWVNTRFRGNKVDFWNQQNLTGTVKHAAVLKTYNGTEHAYFKVLLQHVSLKDGVILEDTMTVTAFASSGYYKFDIETVQVNVTRDTLYLDQYHYGGMALRGNKAWNPDDSTNFKKPWRLTTSEGKDISNANHTRAKWVKVTGEADGRTASVTVFDHPSNFRHPQHIRVHPNMPYWCFFPMVENEHFIAPGHRYSSRYRYMVEDGSGNSKLAEQVSFSFR